MASRDDIAIVEEGAEAGAVVWWELQGTVRLGELEMALDDAGVPDTSAMLKQPSLDLALNRALQECCAGTKRIMRPISRNFVEVFDEVVVEDAADDKHLNHVSVLRARVARDAGTTRLDLRPTRGQEAAGQELEAKVRACLPNHTATLVASDISSWLLDVANSAAISSVSLRARGGFYFVPKHALPTWRAVAAALRSCSTHDVMELPAMRSEECAEAVIKSVRREAEAAFAEMDAYLAGDVSTKGLNSIERRVEEVRGKVEKYAAMFGAQLPDLLNHAAQLAGAAGAIRLERATKATAEGADAAA